MRLPKYIILLGLVCICLINFSQNSKNLDSLLQVLKLQKKDSIKAKILINIADLYNSTDNDKALTYSNEAKSLSEEIGWKKGIADACFSIGYSFYAKGNNSLAKANWLKTLKLKEELGDKNGVSNIQGNIASVCFKEGDYLTALDYNFKSLKLREEIGSKKGISKSLCNIGMIYRMQKKYDKASEYILKALKLAEELGNLEEQAVNLGNLGGLSWQQGQFSSALKYYSKALSIDERLNNKSNVAAWCSNIAGVYSVQGDSAMEAKNNVVFKEKYIKSIEYLMRGLKVSEDSGNENLVAVVLGNIGSLYLSIKEDENAKVYFKRSMDLAIKLKDAKLIMDNYQRYYELYKGMNNYQEALIYHEKYIMLKDSFFTIEKEAAISELQIKFETDRKGAENNALSQQNKILELSVTNHKYFTYGLISLSIFIFGLAFFIIRQRRLKSQQANIVLEQKLLRSQMNPHFIFNSLSSIESFIYENQPKEAGNYLSQFSRLIRLTLENSASEYITLATEIETLKYYLELQKLRLNDNMSYHIEVDESINIEEIAIPPMLTQPFIENVIEHGFRGIKEQGVINISFTQKAKYLEVKVNDNGIGYIQAQQQKDLYQSHKSRSMSITHERLKYLNRSKKQKLIFSIREISSDTERKGTEVIFSIPL